MERILLQGIRKSGNRIEYDYTVTDGLACYFTPDPYVIEYPASIESVPDGVLAIPFVCNVIPIIWLTDGVLEVTEMDKAFYHCLPDIKRGYETMFPETEWKGTLLVERIADSGDEVLPVGRSATMFSGGLDAVHTLVRHLDETPDLISIWGADVAFENAEGWEVAHCGIADYAKAYDLADVVIRSSFRSFIREGHLSHVFSERLKDEWWHGVQHGIGLLGHVAPYAYLKGLSTLYIASSNCPSDGPVRCASNPLIDNYVRYVHCCVCHDGFECSRQDKIHQVVDYVRRTGEQLPLRVCWKTKNGDNCCRCEKCYRTIAGLIAETAEPVDYGFLDAWKTVSDMKKVLLKQGEMTPFLAESQWVHIQDAIVRNREVLQSKPYWKQIKWIEKADFRHPERLGIKPRTKVRLRTRLAKYKLYRLLRGVWRKLKH